MKKKIIPYGRQAIAEEEIGAVVDVLRSDWITQGPRIAEFERAVADYCEAEYAVAVSSGTAALHLAAIAAGFGPGDEVITSPNTFVASANCVFYTGAKPVFADIDPGTLCIDPLEIEEKLASATRGVIPVHFAGQPCDMPAIWKIAQENNLTVIEDAAHALGASYRDQGKTCRVGSCAHSHMTTFSFHPVKHITTGEGGAITTNDPLIYEKLLQLRTHGITKDPALLSRVDGPWYYEMQDLGFNYRITDFQCAIGLEQMKRLDGFVARRRVIAQEYTEVFSGEGEITLQRQREGSESSWHLFVIRVPTQKRLRIFNGLREKGIGVQVHYIPVHLQPWYRKNLGCREGDFPRAEEYYSGAVTIPLFPEMSREDVEYVIETVREAVRGEIG
ncbi:UDP-4-amino-4-deoxy-L-arabinose--oxoglutarate aminotransferase [bacterium BMS3Abin14]|nr:UDP-4-amino-4-deoxy-L-arabinose--oxoglutarate aminotransferase [bacterium BMS3Abin14]